MKIASILIDTITRNDLAGKPVEFCFTARGADTGWLFGMNCIHEGKEATPKQIAEYLRAFAVGLERKAGVDGT